jgi:hypothetical protein
MSLPEKIQFRGATYVIADSFSPEERDQYSDAVKGISSSLRGAMDSVEEGKKVLEALGVPREDIDQIQNIWSQVYHAYEKWDRLGETSLADFYRSVTIQY